MNGQSQDQTPQPWEEPADSTISRPSLLHHPLGTQRHRQQRHLGPGTAAVTPSGPSTTPASRGRGVSGCGG